MQAQNTICEVGYKHTHMHTYRIGIMSSTYSWGHALFLHL